ncbi:MAG: lactonase family protein [Janthinobacterium lividum]
MHVPTSFFRLAALAAGTFLAAGCAGSHPLGTGPGPDLLVYIGTNVGADQANTIYLYRLSRATGALISLGAQPGGAQPTYLALDAARHHLYAVSETGSFKGQDGTGGVSAFAIDPKSGALALLDQQPSTGAGPCYLSLDRTGHNALVANYTGGNVALLPIGADGQLRAASATDQHQPPLGPHKNQDHAHAHCFVPDPANRFAFAADLGTDKLLGYRLDAAGGQFTALPAPAFVAKPGAGPRHLTFHPNGRWAYLENELNSTVTALSYDAQAGRFQEIDTQTTLPRGFVGDNSGADVHVSPDGRFLYTSNRGDNSLAVFSIDAGSGRLALVQHVSTQGKTPRNFSLDPSGQLLLVANQNSGNVFSYFVDKRTGRLRPSGQSAQVPTPMFVAIVPDFTGAK